jgi:hypothetical protein
MQVEASAGYDQPSTVPEQPTGSSDDIELFEMANLTSKDTGVHGIIYISTAQGSHAARVKWYPGRPNSGAPSLTVTVEPQPRAINNSLPANVATAAADRVKAWVALNHADLMEFWTNGATWTRDEVNAFIDGLKKLR